jgi:hypothetical protein
MLTARADQEDGKKVVLIGLDRSDMVRLYDGRGMPLDLSHLEMNGIEVFLFHDETNEIMEKKLIARGLITEESKKVVRGNQ